MYGNITLALWSFLRSYYYHVVIRIMIATTHCTSHVGSAMVLTEYQKQRMLHYYSLGYRAPTMATLLKKQQVKANRKGVHKFIRRYRQTGSIARHPGSGPKSNNTCEIMQVVEQQMRLDDETTAMQLHRLLEEKRYSMLLRTVLRCRTPLGWTFHSSAYCQVICQANKEKRLQWAHSCLDS